MKVKPKLFVVALFLMGLLSAFFFVGHLARESGIRPPATPHHQEAVGGGAVARAEMVRESSAPNAPPVRDTRSAAVMQENSPSQMIPTGITFMPSALSIEHPVLLPLVDAVSNAVLSVNRILKARDYRVNRFSRSIWLTHEDKAQSIVWAIFPYKTNAVVGSVEAIAYLDAALQQRDVARSFRMSFYPESGVLRDFCWADSREVLFVYTNGPFSIDYARRLEGTLSLEMRWDAKGDLTSSNVYDWATRGRIIDGASQGSQTR